jgi:hypothetical protein
MTMPTTGPLKFSQIRTELGSTGPVSLRNILVRSLGGSDNVSRSTLMSDFYGRTRNGWSERYNRPDKFSAIGDASYFGTGTRSAETFVVRPVTELNSRADGYPSISGGPGSAYNDWPTSNLYSSVMGRIGRKYIATSGVVRITEMKTRVRARSYTENRPAAWECYVQTFYHNKTTGDRGDNRYPWMWREVLQSNDYNSTVFSDVSKTFTLPEDIITIPSSINDEIWIYLRIEVLCGYSSHWTPPEPSFTNKLLIDWKIENAVPRVNTLV